MTLQSTLALSVALAFSVVPLASAQAGPDELAEAARLAAHAQTLEDQCRYHESADWLAKSVDRLKHFRSADVGPVSCRRQPAGAVGNPPARGRSATRFLRPPGTAGHPVTCRGACRVGRTRRFATPRHQPVMPGSRAWKTK